MNTYVIQPNYVSLWILIFFIIYHNGNPTAWNRKGKNAGIALLLLTIIQIPFISWTRPFFYSWDNLFTYNWSMMNLVSLWIIGFIFTLNAYRNTKRSLAFDLSKNSDLPG
jgi:hypothetical protein